MDWGSRCLRGLVARELSSDDSVGEERKKTTEKQKNMSKCIIKSSRECNHKLAVS